ncbi:hypothetical protein CANARDRAFT_27713, partial [[Candida] arabinofermentans NRRL YB-2248]
MSNYREYQRVIKLTLNTTSPSNSHPNTNSNSLQRPTSPPSNNKPASSSSSSTSLVMNQTATPPSSSAESSPRISPISSPKQIQAQTQTQTQLPISNNSSSSKDKNSNPKKKITRTKTGCFCCRRRKKKCDEIKPSCSGCSRNMLTCVYPTLNDENSCIVKKNQEFNSSSAKKQSLSKKEFDYVVDNLNQELNSSLYSSNKSETDSNNSFVSPLSSPTLNPYEYRSSRIKSNELNNHHHDDDVTTAAAILVNKLNIAIPKYPKSISIKSLL